MMGTRFLANPPHRPQDTCLGSKQFANANEWLLKKTNCNLRNTRDRWIMCHFLWENTHWKSLFTHLIGWKTQVNYLNVPRQLIIEFYWIWVSATNLAETLSSIIILILPKKIQISLKNPTKSYQIYSKKSQVSNHKAINLHFSCYKCFFFSFWVDLN